jgi:hypothetical protein
MIFWRKEFEKIIEIDEKRKNEKEKKWPWLRQTMILIKGDCSQPKLATPSWPPHFFSLPMIFWRKKFEKIHRNGWGKNWERKVTLIKTDYEEGRLQPTPAGYPQLATPRANHFLLVYKSFQNFIFWILGLKFDTHLQEPFAPRCFWIWHYRTISSPRLDRNALDWTTIC